MQLLSQSNLWLLLCVVALTLTGCGDENRLSDRIANAYEKLGSGDYAAAVRLLESVAGSDEATAGVYCNLGIAYWRLGRFDEAIDSLTQAAELSGANAVPLEFLAAVYAQRGHYAEAEDVLRDAIARAPHSERVLTAAAAVKLRRGDRSGARSLLTRVLRMKPDYAPAVYNLAYSYREDNVQEAVRYYRRYMQLAPRDPHVMNARAFIGSLNEGTSSPDTAARYIGPGERSLQHALHSLQRRPPDIESAAYHLSEARQHAPGNPDVVWQSALLYDQQLRDAAQAARYYLLFSVLLPGDVRAAQALQRARQLDADGSVAARVRADREKARELYRQAYREHGDGDWDAAEALYQQVIEHHPGHGGAAYELARLYRSKEKWTEAESMGRMAVLSDPENIMARSLLAVIYAKLESPDDALRELKAIIAVKPDYADAYFKLGSVYAGMGRTDDAKVNFSQFLRLAPEDPRVAHVQRWMNRQM